MNVFQKMKVQRALDRILSGQFDENYVENLFVGLRPYCGKYRIFREIGDFLAHSNAREKGITKEFIERLFLMTKYWFAYLTPPRTLNISNPFPIFVKRLMWLQVDLCKPAELRQKFKISPDSLKGLINKLFKENKITKMASPKRPIKPGELTKFQHLLGFMNLDPVFSVDDLIEDLVGVLQTNKLSFERDDLMAQRDSILLCLMLLFHRTEVIFDGKSSCRCYIAFRRIPPNTLLITAEIKAVDENGDQVLFYPNVIQSDLSVFDYVEESLLEAEENELGDDKSLLYFDEFLCLTKNKKLGQIHG
jgi:hypothetical protein